MLGICVQQACWCAKYLCSPSMLKKSEKLKQTLKYLESCLAQEKREMMSVEWPKDETSQRGALPPNGITSKSAPTASEADFDSAASAFSITYTED